MNYENESLLPKKKSSIWNFSITFEQLTFVIIVILPGLAPGMSNGFASIALPELDLNLNESAWFASLPTVGFMIGNCLAGYIIDMHGRKKSFFANTIPGFIGYIFLAGSSKIPYLYIGQFCAGLSQGAVALVATVYIAESLAPDNLEFRSSLASWNILAITFGIALTYFFGYFLHYRNVALIAAAFSLISSILILVFIPESPAWLDQQGRYEEAKQARFRLGLQNSATISTEIYQRVDENRREPFSSYILKIKRKDVYKPLILTITYFFFQQFSGTQIYTAHMVDMIDVKSVSINPYFTTLLSGIFMMVGQFGYIVLLPQLGLRKIAIVSSIGAGLTTLILGICIGLNNTTSWYSTILDYIHISSVWLNVVISAIGIATIPYTIVGEIFPHDAKGFASIPIFSVSIFYFINLMVYPYALALSNYAIYCIYGIVGLSSTFFIYNYLPETVGRTLYQIIEELST